MKNYIVNADGWVAGRFRKKGEVISMKPSAAKYENVTLEKDDPKPVEKSQSKRGSKE